MRVYRYFATAMLLLCALFLQAEPRKAQHTFALGDSTFLLDGKPFQMISAEMHYPRIPRECWRARMQAAKAMGINTLGRYWAIGPQQTLYVPSKWLKKGSNSIVVLELVKSEQTTLSVLEHPILDRLK